MTIRFHWAAPQPDWPDRVRSDLASLEIFAGSPGEILEVDGAFYFPQFLCLYDTQGRRIQESCIRRGPQLAEIVHAGPESIALPQTYQRCDDALCLLSFCENAWGHFLTEGINRLWAILEGPSDPSAAFLVNSAVCSSRTANDFFTLAGVDANRLLTFQAPTRIAKVFIPTASFHNRGKAFTVHAKPPHAAAERLLAASSERKCVSGQPLYLSRSQFRGLRTVRGERLLEDRLSSRGVRVVHPEQLDLKQQIRMFNEHNIFIGCWGSAFHGLLFRCNPVTASTHVFCQGMINTNFILVDAILGLDANYVQCLYSTPGATQKWPRVDYSIDVEAAVSYLKTAGLM